MTQKESGAFFPAAARDKSTCGKSAGKSVLEQKILILRQSRGILNHLHMRPFVAEIAGIEHNAADDDVDHDRSPDEPDRHAKLCKNQRRQRKSEKRHAHPRDHRKEGVSGGLDRAAVNNRHAVEKQVDGNEAEHDFREADHLRIALVEHSQRHLRHQNEQNGHKPHVDERQIPCALHGFLSPVHVVRPDGLPHENRHGLPDAEDRRERDGIQPEGNRRRRPDVLAVGSDHNDENIEGGKVDEELEPVRHPEAHQTPQQPPVDDIRAGVEVAARTPGDEKEIRINQHSDQRRKICPPRGACDSELRSAPVPVDQCIVERNVHQRDEKAHAHHHDRLSASAPERAECGVEKKKHIADGKDFEITDFLRSDVRIMPEERKKRIRPEISCCQDRSTGQRKENALPDRCPDTSRGARSGILRYERSRETDGSEKKAGDCKTGQSAGETCGNRLLRIMRKHDAVGKQIEGVSRRAHNQRQRDPQDFKQSPFRREKLVLLNFHKLLQLIYLLLYHSIPYNMVFVYYLYL